MDIEKFKKVKSKFKLNKKQTQLINRLGNILNKCQEANIEIFCIEGELYATNNKAFKKYYNNITFRDDMYCGELCLSGQIPVTVIPTSMCLFPCTESPEFKNDFIKTFIKKSENADE